MIEGAHLVDLTPFIGRLSVVVCSESIKIYSIDNPTATVPIPNRFRRIADAIRCLESSIFGNLSDYCLSQYLRYVLLDEGSLSRMIDFDQILELGFPARPYTVSFVLTKLCNLSCLHCYNDSRYRDPLELDDAYKIRAVDSIGRWGVENLVLTGGEPTLDPCFPEILAIAHKYKIKVKVSTNGWKIPESLISNIVNGVVRQVNVSVDGADAPTHDAFRQRRTSFERALETLRVLSESSLADLVLNVSVHQNNLSQLDDMVKLAIRYRCTAISFKAVVSTGRTDLNPAGFLLSPESILEFKQKRDALRKAYFGKIAIDGKLIASEVPDGAMESVGCNAAKHALVIDADGSILPCETVKPVSNAANLTRGTAAQAWVSDTLFKSFRELQRKSVGGCGTKGCPGTSFRREYPIEVHRRSATDSSVVPGAGSLANA